MIATFIFNGSILLLLILIPLIYPEALPRQAIAFLMEAPAPPPAQPSPPQQLAHSTRAVSQIENGHIFAPPRIPDIITILRVPEAPPSPGVPGFDEGSGILGGTKDLFNSQTKTPAVRLETKGPVRVSSGVVAALLVQKTLPVYPAIPKAAGIQGTVILQATISKAGTIENLRVVSGPPMLQMAALDAVETWRYRPYLLNGEPVEVETTVNVVFTLAR